MPTSEYIHKTENSLVTIRREKKKRCLKAILVNAELYNQLHKRKYKTFSRGKSHNMTLHSYNFLPFPSDYFLSKNFDAGKLSN